MTNYGTVAPSNQIVHSGSTTIPNNPGQDHECLVKVTGKCGDQDLEAIQTFIMPITMPTGDERDAYWATQGYSLACSNSVTAADYGRTAENYFTDPSGWAKGQPTLTNFFSESFLSFAPAPDGTPAFRVSLNPGTTWPINVKGTQLTQASTVTKAVFSMRLYLPSPRSQQNYFGFGHNWGSGPGGTNIPGGDVRYPDSFSTRMIAPPSGSLRGYVYPCGNNSGGGSFGEVAPGTQNLQADRWHLLEQEICLDSPAGSGGVVKGFLDCVQSNEWNGVLRKQENVYIKGQGFFSGHNPPGAAFQEVSYTTDYKIYIQ
jgi:hypothetical protein